MRTTDKERQALKIMKAYPNMTYDQARWLLSGGAYSPHHRTGSDAIAALKKAQGEGKQIFGKIHEVKTLRLAQEGYEYASGHVVHDTREYMKESHWVCIA